MVQANETTDQVNTLRSNLFRQWRIVVERQEAAQFRNLPSLHHVRRCIARRDIVHEDNRSRNTQRLGQLANIAPGRADLDAAVDTDRKSTRLNSSHYCASRMQSSA